MEQHKILPPNHHELRAPADVCGSKSLTERQRRTMQVQLQLAMTANAEAEVRVIFMMQELRDEGLSTRAANDVAGFIKQRLHYANEQIAYVREGL
jgi:hypothetical protein